MNPIIFFILCVSVIEVLSKEALLFNLDTESFVDDDLCRENGDKRSSPYLAACPAFTLKEKQFNKDVSLTKRSVFSRLIFAQNESSRNIDVNFCEKAFEPAILYNSYDKEYKIGYELYFDGWEFPDKWWYSRRKIYKYYKSVNTKKPKYKIKNQTIPNNASELVIRYKDGEDIMFNFTDGSRTLEFYWIQVLSIKCSKHNKRVEFVKHWKWADYHKNLKDECGNYPLAKQDLYSEENQKRCLKDILVPSSFLLRKNFDLSCGQPYGCLTPSQIIPLWYFSSSSARLASCSHINLIPVWKSIADGNLKKTDLFIITAVDKLDISKIIFGVSGVLKMMVPAGPRKLYLSDAKRDRVVEIPKIIYRIIKFRVRAREFIAVIIIHNDPTVARDADKLCDKNDLLRGWDKIINDDSKTGLTYVCRMTVDLEKKLDVHYYNINGPYLDEIPYNLGFNWIEYDDKKEMINSRFEKLLKSDDYQVSD